VELRVLRGFPFWFCLCFIFENVTNTLDCRNDEPYVLSPGDNSHPSTERATRQQRNYYSANERPFGIGPRFAGEHLPGVFAV
jgi:hypothetical protein